MVEKGSLLERAVAWLVMVWIPVGLTAWCGAMVVGQDVQMHHAARAAEAACTQRAESVAASDAAATHEAYQVCMDAHTITRPEGVTDPTRQPG